jgi:hypothetical protein
MDNLQAGTVESVIDVNGHKRGLKIWIICPVCNEGRWVRIDTTRRKEFTGMCVKCHNKFTSQTGENHPKWNGGTINRNGYKYVKIYPDDPYYDLMARSHTNYVLEHRIVMAHHLGRGLKSTEVVHHLNGIRTDNRIENLELLKDMTAHLPSMAEAATVERLQKEITKLKKIIKDMQRIIKQS